jgi:hypothetical protein
MPQTSGWVEEGHIRDIGSHWRNWLTFRVSVNSVCYEADNE